MAPFWGICLLPGCLGFCSAFFLTLFGLEKKGEKAETAPKKKSPYNQLFFSLKRPMPQDLHVRKLAMKLNLLVLKFFEVAKIPRKIDWVNNGGRTVAFWYGPKKKDMGGKRVWGGPSPQEFCCLFPRRYYRKIRPKKKGGKKKGNGKNRKRPKDQYWVPQPQIVFLWKKTFCCDWGLEPKEKQNFSIFYLINSTPISPVWEKTGKKRPQYLNRKTPQIM